ncbi:MAG: COQ9 family protein [Alphaproteobacteria bacterium]|nr:COQ9 family protein [Alphaproteobacteria bacterium]MCW5742966.1 COQ9 family protein [Alphaproteobacteria bacterium]
MSTDEPTANPLKDKVLDAVLAHVPFDGWTRAAIDSAVRAGAITRDEATLAFPGGMIDMIAWHSLRADRLLVEEMERRDVASLKVRERVTLGVRMRLEQNVVHREAIRRALAMLALPFNGLLASRLLYRTVDAIWYAAGDTATDFNFYTKRALLAGVYSSTLLFWLNDRSEGFSATWAFLDRRVEDVMRIEKLKSRMREFGTRATSSARPAG